MPYADLHAHTTNSDGTLELDEVPAAARDADVSVVAVTDHDRTHPDLDAPVVERDGVTLVHAIELRVDAGFERVDLLGYGVVETDALAALVDRVQTDRAERGQAIIDNVEDALGIDLGIEGRPGLGRPNVARAVADHPDTDYDVQGVFDDLIGNDGPCYVARDVPTFEAGREVLAGACAVVGLAHPFRYDDPERALALTETLDAVERDYPYGDGVDADLAAVDAAASEHDLLVTAGTDAHERELGVCGLSETDYAPLRDRLAAHAGD
ncbi:PHP domain-containing protein [Halorubellus salinus]|uniref:PHP domain-containing protein n=1 Tax=Halorubellus salinus TaxID=755309 RepID=UPI001D06323A|nr:PHP domain-containing protein [Halorubellus salinus]